VDPRNVFPSPVSEGVVEMVSVLFTQVLRSGILGSSPREVFELASLGDATMLAWWHHAGGEDQSAPANKGDKKDRWNRVNYR
jgi:hypothetical protein